MNMHRVGWLAVPVVALPILLGAAAPAHAAATTRYVATTGDDSDNDCTAVATPCQTIQYAVDQADPGDTVSIAAGSYPESVDIRYALTITGAGASSTFVTGDGEEDPSLFVDGLDTETPPDVTISNVAASNNDSADGIDVEGGNATLTDDAVNNNADNGVGDDSAIFQGSVPATSRPAVADGTDQVTITSSTLSNNGGEGAEENGGGSITVTSSAVNGNQDGGVVVEEGTASILTSTLDSNVGAGAVADGTGTSVSVGSSTISHTAAFAGSDGPAFGGGLAVFPGGSATVSESTLADNTNFGVLDVVGTVQVNNSTITGTSAGTDQTFQGGLVYDATSPALRSPSARTSAHWADRSPVPADAAAGLTATGTITAQNAVPACAGAVTDGGYNLDSDGTCGFTATGSKSHAISDLGALADNGGPTLTVMPGVLSAARNVIPLGSAGCLATAVDQRGVPRSNPANGTCDVGAVESAVVDPKLTIAVSGTHHKAGWYRGTVTVQFTCTVGSAPLTAPCPGTEHLRASGSHTVSKTIHALDGGSASASAKLKIDNEKPKISVKIVPVKHHHTTVLKLRGTCTDRYSGVAHCSIHTHRVGSTVHYTVKAGDVVGNHRTKKGEYHSS